MTNELNLFHMFTAKIFAALTTAKNYWIAASLAPIIIWIERYVFSDWSYLPSLMILIGIDFATGVTAAWKHNEAITSKGWRNTIVKIVQYASFLIVTHIIVNFELNGEKVQLPIAWITEGAYVFLIAIEVKSVYENLTRINSNLDFLKPIIKKLEEYMFEKNSKKEDTPQ